jgi:hypothetical protein
MVVANSEKEIKTRFKVLAKINNLFRKYNSMKGVRKISTTDFESHYGEYLVASKLLNEGFEVRVENKKGYDIKVEKPTEARIEVKTSRLQKRIPKGKHMGWGWVVKKSQWDPPGFDYLVCIACDWQPGKDGFLAFSYDEVIKYFSKGSWEYQKFQRKVKDYLRLGLYKGGLKAFNEDLQVLKAKITLTGKPTPFERNLNRNSDIMFKKYSWERFVELLKKTKR